MEITISPTCNPEATPPAEPVLITTSGLVNCSKAVVPTAAVTLPIPDCNNATDLSLILPSKIVQLAICVTVLSVIKSTKISTSCAIAPTIPIFIAIPYFLFRYLIYVLKNPVPQRYNHRYTTCC